MPLYCFLKNEDGKHKYSLHSIASKFQSLLHSVKLLNAIVKQIKELCKI